MRWFFYFQNFWKIKKDAKIKNEFSRVFVREALLITKPEVQRCSMDGEKINLCQRPNRDLKR